MDAELAVPVVVFLLFLIMLFYINFRAQKRIKEIENSAISVSNSINKDDIVVECALIHCNCCNCRNTNVGVNATSGHSDVTSDNVWTVSRQINEAFGPTSPSGQRWPTHDHHISLDGFTTMDHTQRSPNGAKLLPPPYSEVDLPSYDQAIAELPVTMSTTQTGRPTQIAV